ncbi:MAG: 8-oxo-dGTP diphosphatase MutT [Gammaproteobacteria bacterium]|nr:8-oxo-dGTP diphosphatase MutT [Gammaproteobacteria bacterium]MDH3362470.1 8-oxo-dGTP diphosphatase MutT [Gammaproteobacteria bacterium]MDH3480483.1 8-oxo-dGTP diphosphatase MutT [Gammaproteobacteria bacterium]
MNHFDVAAGILFDSQGRVLIAERLGDGPFHGMWEFPGGKIGPDESAPQALSRELAEELGIEVTHCSSLINLRHEYDDRIVTIEFFIVSGWNSDPVGREGQELRWVRKDRLGAQNLLPADMPVIEVLQQMES